MMRTILVFVLLAITFFGFSCGTSTAVPSTSAPKKVSVAPLFNATALAGKSPSQVDAILGKPTDSFTPSYDPDGEIRSYARGEETMVEFEGDSIKSLVIFFQDRNADSRTAHELVGLDYLGARPSEISNITTGKGWIKIFY